MDFNIVWYSTGIYLLCLGLTSWYQTRLRRKHETKIEDIWKKHIAEYEANAKKEMDNLKGRVQENVNNAFLHGATAGAHSVVEGLKKAGILPKDFHMEFHAVIADAIEKAKESETEADDQFLRALKIKP